MFQLTYTTLFGWFASYLFVRTGSILPPLVAHVFCNMMGIYLPNTAIARHPSRRWSESSLGTAMSGLLIIQLSSVPTSLASLDSFMGFASSERFFWASSIPCIYTSLIPRMCTA